MEDQKFILNMSRKKEIILNNSFSTDQEEKLIIG